jgi:two-component system, sensor histidine kinase and response regulator
VIDWDELHERLCGDEELVGTIVDLFVDECPAWIAAVVAAAAEQDAEGVRTSAHSLKGAAANLAAHGVAAAAGRLELMGRERNLADCSFACASLTAECERLMIALRTRARAN